MKNIYNTKKVKNYVIQYDCIGNHSIIAKSVDVHYSKEICNAMKQLHPQMNYTYMTEIYYKSNKDIFTPDYFR
jgi:hypothetical protein